MRNPEEELVALDRASLRRSLRTLDSGQGVTVRRDGRTLTNFSSNDYLGLAGATPVVEAFREAAARYGVGSGASRLLCGSLAPHRDLEETLASLVVTDAAVTFASGFATAVGTLTALLQKGDVVILDKLCHASLIDGARQSGATVRVYPHNNLDRLASHLAWADRSTGGDGRILVVTESVFSMDGDTAPLGRVAELTKQQGALLLVDEAHAFGVFGPRGMGLGAGSGAAGAIDLHMGTLSKAAGVSGGYVCASRPLVDLIVNRARPLIYSTAPPPAAAAAAKTAVELIASKHGDALREKLWANIRRFRTGATAPIVPVVAGDEGAALAAAAELEAEGFLVPAVRFPSVARGSARLRVTFSAAHTTGQIDGLKGALLRSSVTEAAGAGGGQV